jgi:putative nucleotidyltransferase with HDIG domain
MTSLDRFIDEINRLTPIPAVTQQLLAVADKPDSSMADIARIMQYDPVITAEVLKTCNSAYYGIKHPAESVKDAVNMLGIDKVVELALAHSGASALSGTHEGYGLEQGEMWKYSIASAVVAKDVAARLGLKNKNTLFTSALIKDIGKIILHKYVLSAREKIDRMVNEKAFSFLEAEKTVFGIHHAELGAMIAKMWHFSPRMIKIIRHHHLADEAMVKDKEVAAVYLADSICMMMGIGVGSDGLAYRFKKQAMENLKITATDVSLIIAEFGMNMAEVEALLKMR